MPEEPSGGLKRVVKKKVGGEFKVECSVWEAWKMEEPHAVREGEGAPMQHAFGAPTRPTKY